jgi:hypothetical protein
VSYWQGVVNFDVLKADGAHGVFCRAGVGASYTDPTFAGNYLKAGAAGLLRSSYFVINPMHTVTAQIDRWYMAHPERDVVPRSIDLESDYGAPAAQIADRTWQMCEIVKVRDGVYPIIYTRKMLADLWLASWTLTQKNSLEWWLAQYLLDVTKEHPGPPDKPNGVNVGQVILHQTSDKLPPPPGGAGSKALDRDRWCLGDTAAMYVYINDAWGTSAPPFPPEPCAEEIIKTVKVNVTGAYLNVRAEPTSASVDLGELYDDSVVPVVEEKNGWYRIGQGWISKTYTTDI